MSGIPYRENILIELENIYLNIQKDIGDIEKNNEEISDKIQDILHYLEIKKFNVPEGYFSVLELKQLLCDKRNNYETEKKNREILKLFEGCSNFKNTKSTVKGMIGSYNKINKGIEKKVTSIDTKYFEDNYKEIISDNLQSDSFATKLAEMLKDYKDRRDELKVAMSAIEKKLNLLLEKIEFSSFGLVDGYYFAKAIQQLRIERRNVKDEFNRFICLDLLLLNNDKVQNSVKKLEKTEVKKQTRRYKPRVLKSYGVMN